MVMSFCLLDFFVFHPTIFSVAYLIKYSVFSSVSFFSTLSIVAWKYISELFSVLVNFPLNFGLRNQMNFLYSRKKSFFK